MRRLGRLLGLALAVLAVSDGARAAEAWEVGCGPGTRSWLVPFDNSAFPYDGAIPDAGIRFLDQTNGERRGHTSPRGGVYWEDETYSDRRVLLSWPTRLDPARPVTIVLFLHGNLATLERDVCKRQRVPAQVAASSLNAVLVAPQLAVNALDSSAGRFWENGFLLRFLDEAAGRIAERGGPAGLRSAPVVIAAYSGGYLPAIFAAERGGAGARLRGLVLLDALFGEVDRYAGFLAARRGSPAFVNAYGPSSRGPSLALKAALAARGVAVSDGLGAIGPGATVFVPAGEASHGEFVTRAFAPDPLKAVLHAFSGGGSR